MIRQDCQEPATVRPTAREYDHEQAELMTVDLYAALDALPLGRVLELAAHLEARP